MKLRLLALGLLAPAAAAGGDFLPGTNSGALARQFALPSLGQPQVLQSGRDELRALFDVTNEFVTEGFAPDGSCPLAAECALLDGETARLLLSYRRGLGAGWDFHAELPLLAQGGGFLDGWIEEWHDWFNLPTGARETEPRDQYEFRYTRASADPMRITDSYSGLGDVTLGIGRGLGEDVALRGMVKLPTGDARRLGGGNLGGALWLDAALPLPGRASGFAAAGMSFNETGEVLPGLQNSDVLFGGLGLALPVPFTERLRLLAQLYGHSRLYDGSALTPFARFGLPLTLGLQVQTGARSHLDLGFQEDLAVNASPDFTAYLALTVSP